MGYTEILPALKTALSYSPGENYSRTFVIITDGYVTVEHEAFKLINDNIGNANMFAFGIGSSVNRYIIEGMAHAGNGEPFFITNQDEADVYGKTFLELIRNPVLTNIKIDYGNFDAYDLNIEKIPDLYSEKPVVIFGKYRGNPNGKITISGVRGENNPYSEVINIRRRNNESTAALRYLWARNRIRHIGDFGVDFDNSIDKKAVITELGLKYNLLTDYTSFIAVDNNVRVPVYNLNNTDEPELDNMQYGNYKTLNFATNSEVEEVVVTSIGIRKSNKSLSYSAIYTSNTRSVENLQGKVAGVSIISSSGKPGASSNIIIRGNSSSINNNPLYIIDGIPTNAAKLNASNSAGAINPETISSIRFFKGSEAVSLYGNRASNGVILIQTKNNEQKKFDISFSSSFSINKAHLLPEIQQDFAQGREISGVPIWQSAADYESFSWGPAIADLEYDNSGNLVEKGTGNGNPAKAFNKFDFLQKGYSNLNNLKFSYNQKAHHLNINLGNYSEKGVLQNSNVKDNSLKIDYKTNFSSLISNKISFSAKNKNMNNLSPDHSYSDIYRNMLISSPSFNDSSLISFDGGKTDNPYFSASKNSLNHEISDYSLALSPKVETGNFIFSLNIFDNISYVDSKSVIALNSAKNSYGEMNFLSQKSYNFFSNLNINFKSGIRDFNFDTDLEGFYSKNGHRYTKNLYTGFASDIYIAQNALLHDFETQLFEKNLFGSHAKISTDFNNTYFLTLTGELTNSNLSSSKYLFSKSVNIAAVLSEYYYSGAINYLKLYASFVNSKKDLPAMWNEKLYLYPEFSIYDHLLEPKSIINSSNINPENSSNLAFGTNFKIFNSKIELDAEYYIQNTKNYFAPVYFPAGNVDIINAGSMKKIGFEILLKVNAINRSNFKFSNILVLYSYNTSMSEISNIYHNGIESASMPGVSIRLANNLPAGALFGTTYMRDSQGNKILDAQGIPVVNSDYSYLGSSEPDFIASFNSEIEIFRKLNIEFNIDARKGGKIWNGTQNALNYYGVSQQSADFRIQNPNAYEIMTANGEFGVAEDAITDASMLSLKFVSLGYVIQSNKLRKMKINIVQINLFAQNLLTFSKTKGFSPDSFFTENSLSSAINYFNLPELKSYGIKLSIKF